MKGLQRRLRGETYPLKMEFRKGSAATVRAGCQANPHFGGKRAFRDAGPVTDLRHCRLAGAVSFIAPHNGLFET